MDNMCQDIEIQLLHLRHPKSVQIFILVRLYIYLLIWAFGGTKFEEKCEFIVVNA